MKKVLFTVFCYLFIAGVAVGKNKQNDRELIDRVAGWQIDNFAKVKHKNLDWTNGALYRGMIEWADYTDDKKYYDFLMGIGQKNSWDFLPRVYHADDLCVAQMYVGMYRKYKDPAMIDNVRKRLDQIVWYPSDEPLWTAEKVANKRWWWCDALFMAPAVFVEMYNLTKDEKYLQYMDREYKLTTDSLFSKDDGLYFRDKNYLGKKEKNGSKVFWGRGNGWVFGGLALILEHLPKDHYTYNYYLNIYKEMAAAVIRCQDKKGSWHASMYDHKAYPQAENSASGFFVYGLAWGINNNILEGKDYKNAAVKGWKALKSYVNEEGKLGSVQPIAAAPQDVTSDMTEVYGVGAFLLAGKEMLKFNNEK